MAAINTTVTHPSTSRSRSVGVAQCRTELTCISYNRHGYNQGCHTVRDLVLDRKPDIFILQEHFLTPNNLCKFEENFPTYICAGSSAMNSCVESGVLRGRPFGGVMILVNN